MEEVKLNIEVQPVIWLGESGIELSVYIGDGPCDPIVEHTFDYEGLIEKHFDMFKVNGLIHQREIADAELLVIKLEQMAKYARQTLIDVTQDMNEAYR
jgi:hypothetical protein|tara:strand:+ start:261 stop:554 length:294 start_codon:yes stop_codon:yes gene_type:complete